MQGNILFFSYFRKVNRFVADLSLLSDFGSSAGFHVDERAGKVLDQPR